MVGFLNVDVSPLSILLKCSQKTHQIGYYSRDRAGIPATGPRQIRVDLVQIWPPGDDFLVLIGRKSRFTGAMWLGIPAVVEVVEVAVLPQERLNSASPYYDYDNY